MAPKFGTSGLRGLVVELTDELVRDYVQAFVATCDHGGCVLVGRDLRPSSPEIAGTVLDALAALGLRAFDCGALPTPALALAASAEDAGAIMVTGSHIPADRNGLKFYSRTGEILKDDEARILAALGSPRAPADAAGSCEARDAVAAYATRYVSAFGRALDGLTIGVYQHSSVARDLLVDVLSRLGATPVPIARSDTFIPVDTEAVDPETRALFQGWIRTHGLDALVSTDGDADRPMVVDDLARVVPGDVLGAVTAETLGAETIVTPVSSNTMIDSGGMAVVRTRIGSPYVIAGMDAILGKDTAARVVGYEANGGFLLGFDAQGPNGPLSPLMTRDCLLPIIAPLAAARAGGVPLSRLVDDLPPRFTAADRLQEIPPERARALLDQLTQSPDARQALLGDFGPERGLDVTDGLRIAYESGEIIHLRPSGNAPEFRCYAEAADRDRAGEIVDTVLGRVRAEIG